ncbi:MAG: DUF433 domain-containing protein [Gemmatimonadetes bacterium]|nr:DUF433 domain-containing protein [Gemmatimonadota bacterium]MCY3943963.1 DUF433 domain-containing protein [Gemmatimonadota bacterium]
MDTRPGRFDDIRDAPAYSFPEASRHLGVPQATLRCWVLGRAHQGEPGPTVSEPLIRAPSGSRTRISFNNVVEAHVLRALRTGRGVRMAAVRDALTYAENSLGIRRLLLRDELSTSGQDLVLEQLGSLIGLSRSGQMAMRKLLAAYLERVERDYDTLPFRLYPFRAAWSGNKPIVIDPRISFGRPTVAGSGVSTGALVDRIDAGETVETLARDYGLEIAQIEDAILYERAA